MGGKRARQGKQIHLCIAILIFFCPLACTLSKTAYTTIMGIKFSDAKGDEAREHLALGKKYLAQGNYANALKEQEKVISLAGNNSPADEALFAMGVIYADPANPAKDSGKSLLNYRKLIKDYPKSYLVEQVKAIIGVLQENDKLNRTVERLNTTLEESKRTVERLNIIIEESKRVDIEIERKKRRKAQ